MIELEEMSFLLFNYCCEMNKKGLNDNEELIEWEEEFEVLLEWDEELKDSYNHIFEDENEIQIIINIIKCFVKKINIKLYNNKVI